MENNLIEVGRCVQAKGHVAGGWSGSMTGLAANALVYAARNAGPAEIIVDAVDLAFVTDVLSTAAPAGIAFGIHKVPMTALTNAGARATPPAPVRKRTLDAFLLQPSNVQDKGRGFDGALDVQIAGAGALTGATITGGIALFQDDPQGVFVPLAVVNAAASALMFCGQYRWEPRNGIPLTLEPDEALIVISKNAFPTTLAGKLFASPDLRIS